MRVRAGSCLLALSAVLVLTGCSSEEPPSSLPRLPSVSASATPPSASRTPPPESTPETPQAASAFALYFLAVVDEAFKTGDPALVENLAAEGCGGCDSLAGSVATIAANGQRQVGGEYIDIQTATPAFTGGDVLVDITYRRNASQLLDGSGDTISRDPEVPLTSAQMRLLRRGAGWVVQGFRIVSP